MNVVKLFNINSSPFGAQATLMNAVRRSISIAPRLEPQATLMNAVKLFNINSSPFGAAGDYRGIKAFPSFSPTFCQPKGLAKCWAGRIWIFTYLPMANAIGDD